VRGPAAAASNSSRRSRSTTASRHCDYSSSHAALSLVPLPAGRQNSRNPKLVCWEENSFGKNLSRPFRRLFLSTFLIK